MDLPPKLCFSQLYYNNNNKIPKTYSYNIFLQISQEHKLSKRLKQKIKLQKFVNDFAQLTFILFQTIYSTSVIIIFTLCEQILKIINHEKNQIIYLIIKE